MLYRQLPVCKSPVSKTCRLSGIFTSKTRLSDPSDCFQELRIEPHQTMPITPSERH